MHKTTLLITVTAVILGALVTILALHNRQSNAPASADGQVVSAEYGARIIRNTALEIGSGQADPALRYSGNNLACASCHINSGQSPGQLSLLESAVKYPALSGRDGGVADLVDRINGCMQRSMNGRRMERDHVAMQSMVAYVEELGRVFHAMGESSRRADEPPAFVEPDRQANVESGATVYVERCQICHGSNGEGLKNTDDIADGYLFPPLWGPDSYNIGAGMARILTASRFIKARMPLGGPDLTDDETFDVTAYMNAQDRPGMDALELDYPELTNKPVDSPYPPYADPFPVEQHRLGPFGPIRAFYQGQ